MGSKSTFLLAQGATVDWEDNGTKAISADKTIATVHLFVLLLVLAVIPAVLRADERSVPRTLESSMLVIAPGVVGTDGRLESYALQLTLPAEVRRLVDGYLAGLLFDLTSQGIAPREPVKIVMSVQVVARQYGPGNIRLAIGDSLFKIRDRPAQVAPTRKLSLTFPVPAWQNGVTGILHLVMRVNGDGRVVDAHVERVDLTGFGSEREMQRGREVLARGAQKDAMKWTFDVAPESLDDAGLVELRVAIAYQDERLTRQAKVDPWVQYVRGPYVPTPWDSERNTELGAMVPGWLFPSGSTLRPILGFDKRDGGG